MPKVIRCKELPQWIISSDRAAFHPFSNTIYIREDLGWKTLLHEYCHWFAWRFKLNFIHGWLDKNKP